VYKCTYLTDELCQLADVEARQQLRSSSSTSLIVNRTRLPTVGDRAFPVATAHIWNSLPDLVTSAPSVAVFRLKTHLFNISYPFPLWLYSACAVTLAALDTIIVLSRLLGLCLTDWAMNNGTAHLHKFNHTVKLKWKEKSQNLANKIYINNTAMRRLLQSSQMMLSNAQLVWVRHLIHLALIPQEVLSHFRIQ